VGIPQSPSPITGAPINYYTYSIPWTAPVEVNGVWSITTPTINLGFADTAADEGNDNINAGSGNDVVFAGGGDDFVQGGAGDNAWLKAA